MGGLFDKPKTLEELAEKVQQNFDALSVKTPETGRQAPLSAQSTTQRDGSPSGNVIYQEATITLTPGSWLVWASCSILNLTVADAVSVGVYDRTNAAEVADSRGFANHSDTAIWGGVSTLIVHTVTANTDVCPYACRNGASTVRVGSAAGSTAGKIMAWRIGY